VCVCVCVVVCGVWCVLFILHTITAPDWILLGRI
jgi:hypothetical protein